MQTDRKAKLNTSREKAESRKMQVATSGLRCHSITCKPGAWISQAGTDGTEKRHPAASFFFSSVNLWHSLLSAIT